jgi:hypothetical protein
MSYPSLSVNFLPPAYIQSFSTGFQSSLNSLSGSVSTINASQNVQAGQILSMSGGLSVVQQYVKPAGINAPILSSNGLAFGGGATGVRLNPIIQSDNTSTSTIPGLSSDYIEFGSGLSTIFMGCSSEYIDNFVNGKHNMIMKPKWLIDDTEKLILVLGMIKDVVCHDGTLGKYAYFAGDPRANGMFKYFDVDSIDIDHIEKLYKEIDVNNIPDTVFKSEYDIANTVIKMVKQFKKTKLANSGLEVNTRYETVNELRQGYFPIHDLTAVTKPTSKNGVEAYKNFLLSIQSVVSTLKQDTINAIMTGGYRPHILKTNPSSVKVNPLYQGFDSIVKGRWNALKNTYPTSTFNATSNISSLVTSGKITPSEATGAITSYTNIVNDISAKFNDYFNYIQNPTGAYQTSMIRDDYPGMYTINANTGVGDDIYKYQVCFYAGYAENDSVLSLAKTNPALTGANYTNVEQIFNNYNYFLDTNTNTNSVEKLHDVGIAFNTLFNDVKDFAAKQLKSLTGAYDGLSTNQIAEAIFRKSEMKSDREVLGSDYTVKNPDGSYVYNANLGFQYVWLEHYTGPAGSITGGTLLNRFADSTIANYNNDTADKVTFYRNFLQDYTRKFLNTNIKPLLNQILGPRSLAEYNSLLAKDPIVIGGNFPGFATAVLDAANQQVYWISETNNPRYFNLGWFRSTIVLHEWLLGHGLEIPVTANALTANSSKFSYARRHIRSSYQAEGWATYMELFGHEVGLFNKVNASGALINTGNYLNDVDWESVLCGAVDTSRTAARLVCDTELNYSKYAKSFSEIEAKFKELTGYFFEEDYIGLSTRFTGVPGQSLSYAPGCISILAAKNVAKAALGANFNIGDFHDFILIDNPSYSIDSLREATLRYIASKQ